MLGNAYAERLGGEERIRHELSGHGDIEVSLYDQAPREARHATAYRRRAALLESRLLVHPRATAVMAPVRPGRDHAGYRRLLLGAYLLVLVFGKVSVAPAQPLAMGHQALAIHASGQK
ncbi:hypothetical protein FQZ97_1162190 [compost metagenome]